MKFQIVSDSSCDLPKERAQELGVDIVPFYVSFEEENYMKEGVDISVEDFYQMMADRAGTFPKTSMPSVQDYVDVFEKYVKDGVPVLCICLNAAFSGSIQSAMNAKNQILEDYPEAQIEVVDSEEVTALQGMFVEEACRLRGAELDMKEAVKLLEEIRPTGRIFFTTNDLDYLQHGGRIGRAAATIGNDALIVIVPAREWMIELMGISSSAVMPTPSRPEQSPMMKVSALKTCATLRFEAPMARKIPISLVRSRTEIYVMIPIMIEETMSDTEIKAIST